MEPHEVDSLRKLSQEQMHKLIIFELGDEYYFWKPKVFNNKYFDLWEHAGAVYHPYWRKSFIGQMDIEYMLPPGNRTNNSPDKKSWAKNLFWIPLGPAAFLGSPALLTKPSTRPFLFSFVGTTSCKGSIPRQEREFFKKELKSSPFWKSLANRLLFHEIDCRGAAFPDYPASMYNSIFVPMIKGRHWEQYRFWEAMEAGCIPVLLRNITETGKFDQVPYNGPVDPWIYHKQLFGDDLIFLESWSDFAPFIYNMTILPQETFNKAVDGRAQRLWQKYRTARQRLERHVASKICEAARG
eukprot:gnl/MRDRNA2_/MRDRNA2_41965_c0_seq1.p1 gnl/MRDRNA2_/MRDRNA2_41965_c0~~gnl/MRDRNA2_/MRDRNA2_41965_c0_seq1.p1  ORF type:complete len:339 (+),score=30.17 gnl/MRDRNA2_/MRDRNA2_41965_c0_seq1:127-1017(+)